MPWQGVEVADAVGNFGQFESGNYLSSTGPTGQEGFKCGFLDERADNAELNGIHKNSCFWFLVALALANRIIPRLTTPRPQVRR